MSPGARIDLHVHSIHSPDGRHPPADLVAGLAAIGLDGLALTDHNSIDGLPRLPELRREHPELILLPGVEVSTREGHLLAYGVTELPPRGRPVDETIEWVNAHGGSPVLAHPFRRTHGVGGKVAQRAAVRAMEVVNGHNGPTANARARSLAHVRSLGATGGSDAHLLSDLGRAWTRFPEAAGSVDDLLDAIARGRTTADGHDASPALRCRVAMRSLGLRLRRGFRSI